MTGGSTRSYLVKAIRKQTGAARVDPKGKSKFNRCNDSVRCKSISDFAPFGSDPTKVGSVRPLGAHFDPSSIEPALTRSDPKSLYQRVGIAYAFCHLWTLGPPRTRGTLGSDLIPTPTLVYPCTHGSESIPTDSYPTPGRIVKWIVWSITIAWLRVS